MPGTHDWSDWHDGYDDPGSTLSWRLGVVRGHVARFLDERPGPVRVLSVCAGDGRDVLGVLGDRDDAERVAVTLVELHPDHAAAARAHAGAALPAVAVDVRETDAGTTDAFAGAVPADLVLLVGIFGNVTDADVERTIGAAPQLCAPGATVLWTRGRGIDFGDLDADVRRWFAAAGFTEVAHDTLERGSRQTVGAVRYDGAPAAFEPGRRLFTFVR